MQHFFYVIWLNPSICIIMFRIVILNLILTRPKSFLAKIELYKLNFLWTTDANNISSLQKWASHQYKSLLTHPNLRKFGIHTFETKWSNNFIKFLMHAKAWVLDLKSSRDLICKLYIPTQEQQIPLIRPYRPLLSIHHYGKTTSTSIWWISKLE